MIIPEIEATFIENLRQLIACPSITGMPSVIDDLLESELTSLGFDVKRIAVSMEDWPLHIEGSPPQVGSGEIPDALIAYPKGYSGESLPLFFAHYDTEMPSKEWKLDPFSLLQIGDWVYGLGAADDKGGIAAILTAVKAAASNEESILPILIFASGKQGGSLGMVQAFTNVQGASYAVYCHPAETGRGLSDLKVSSRGIATIRLTVRGRVPVPLEIRTPASADPRTGVNPASCIAELILEIDSWRDSEIVWSVNNLSSYAPKFGISDRIELDISAWFTRGMFSKILEIVSSRSEKSVALSGSGCDVSVELVGIRANPALHSSSELQNRVREEIEKSTGAVIINYDWHSASDIRFPIRILNVPAVGFGALAGGFYGGEEWVSLSSSMQTVECLVNLLKEPIRL
jgi:acetylornithine deacetylase/succinyl-diaminopimelate desuccinylase-like protein